MFSSAQIWHLRVLLVAGLIAATSSTATSQSSTLTVIDATGAGTGAMQGTIALGIDAAGDVTGTYFDTNSVAHGFLRTANGTITTFDAPGAGTARGTSNNGSNSPFFQGTIPIGINTAGVIAGTYIDANYNYHGFVRAANGVIATFDVPGDITVSSYEKGEGTRPIGINDAGTIVGTYVDPSYGEHGFVRTAGGVITTFDALSGGGTVPICIDAAGDVAGTYFNATSGTSGFLRAAGGAITKFDVPGAGGFANTWELNGTVAIGIDSGGDLVGTYSDTNLVRHGFLRTANGAVSSFDVPGAGLLSACCNFGGELGTVGVGINTTGEIAGAYLDANAVYHGFLRNSNGGITTFNAPNAGSDPLQGTGGLAINASGMIAGTYIDTNNVVHGFIYTPVLTTTTTTLTPTPTPNPSIYQEPVTLTASVSSSGGAPPNGENVIFMGGTTSLGTAILTGGRASLTTMDLPTGTDSITAVYSGDLNFSGSTSAALSQTVNKASSSTTLKSSLNPSTFGQSVTFTANISGQFSGVATGTVAFHNGGTSLGSAAVSSNMAILTTTTLPVGTDSITAVYSGDGNFTGSVSSALSQVVNAPPQAATPTFSPVAGTYASPQTVTISDTTTSATIYYTTNGTIPTASSTKYTGAITVSSSETIEAIAVASGYTNSAVAIANYTINPALQNGPLGIVATGFSDIRGLATDASGNVYVADDEGFAGSAGGTYKETLANGTYSQTNLNGMQAYGVAVDAIGHVYFAGDNGVSVYELTLSNGTYLQSRIATGFSEIRGLAADASGNVYVADDGGGSGSDVGIYKETLTNGAYSQTNLSSMQSYGVAVDASGNVYFAGDNGVSVYKLALSIGTYTQSRIATGFSEIRGLAADATGNAYVADAGDGSTGDVGTYKVTLADGTYTQTNLNSMQAYGVAVDASGNVYFAGDNGVSVYVIKQVVTPTFSPSAGPYAAAQTVTINDATAGATIYYTTNATAPTISSTEYTGAITVSSSETIEAIATASGYSASAAASTGYLITPQAVGGTLDWTWMGGSSALPSGYNAQLGVYGALGTPAAGNVPGGRLDGSSWTDSSGHLWLFGGNGVFAGVQIAGELNDLWEFNPTTNEWVWMAGSSNPPTTGRGHSGAYGKLGTPADGNIPGGRDSAVNWTDGSGNLWLFGGDGIDAIGNYGDLNDLWEFNPSTIEWTWMGGSSALGSNYGQSGIYNTLGTPAVGNIPGGRDSAVNWTDTSGNLWLFGGEGVDSKGNYGDLNDLWEFKPSTTEWTWMGGSSTIGSNCDQSNHCGRPGVYGTLGTPAAGNVPGGRTGATSWTDSGGNFWLFGGEGFDANGNTGMLNDVWEFNSSTNLWTWMGGSRTVGSNCVQSQSGIIYCGQLGEYGTPGTPAVGNIPGGRFYSSSWTDSSRNLWLFGGVGFDANGSFSDLNDLWKFNPSTNQWAWMGGSSTLLATHKGQPGVYGTLGAPSAVNIPGGRYETTNWIDSSGNFWLFGGFAWDASGRPGWMNDFWKYQPPIPTTTSAATIASPSPGSTLTSASTTFTWNAGSGGVTGYYLWVGTSPGTNNLAQIGLLSGTSTTVSLPTNGAAIYVRLWTVINGTTYLYNDYTYTEFTQAATMISPSNGSTLTAASTTFTWNAGAGGVTGYYLWVGTSPGTNNLAQIGLLSGTSTNVTLPINGAAIYVRLWTVINGTTYLYNDYTYTEFTQSAATMASPSNGSTLTSASTTFTWNAGAGGVTGYYLWVGTSPGTNNLAQIGLLSGTSTNVTLPINGAAIYVRLWTVINGTTYLYNDYTYTEFTQSAATMASPLNGSTLTAASTTFTWNAGAGGVTGYYLWVGTSPGTGNLAQVGLLSGTSTTVNLPTNGAAVYVRLWTVINGTTYLYNDYTYTELTQAATMASPSPGSALTAASTTFTWNAGAGGVTGYYLWIGTSPGTNNLAQVGLLSGTSTTVTLPTNGAAIYVRLWTVINGTAYLYNDYTYTEFTQAATMISPSNDSTLTAASTTFTWNAGAGGVTGYYLWVGTALGTDNLAQIGLLSGTSTTVTLPSNGATIYVRLWTVINGTTYLYNDYTYTGFTQSAATMASPSPGGTLASASTTFTWNAGSGGVTGYYLWVGTSPGTNNLAQIGLLSGTSTTVTLPTGGAAIYVRLWTVINGTTYLYNDYTYTEAP